MDKGIFYLLCTIITVGSVVATSLVVTRQIANSCGKMVAYQTKTVVVTPTVEPTATPSAVLRVLKSAPAVTKGVK